jgi:hypothetical protein
MRYLIILIFVHIFVVNTDDQKCLNKGTANDQGVCTCPVDYIGQNCNIPAVLLKPE